MAIVYRDDKGSPLTPDEVDENFRTLAEAFDAFTAPAGRGIQSVTVSGNRMTIHLTDATTQGPFLLPAAYFRWTDEFVGGTEYEAYDLFTVSGSGVYLVLRAWTSATEFDPNASDTDGPFLALMFGIVPIAKIPVVHAPGDYSVTASDAGAYIRLEDTDGGLVTVTADVEWEEGDVVTLHRVAGQVDISGATDVIINVPADCLPTLRIAGSTATLINVGSDQWDLSGDLALASTTTGP